LLREASSDLKNNYLPSVKDELDKNFSKYNLNGNKAIRTEVAIFLKSDEKLVIESLLSAIRNGFAHGCFEVRKDKDKGNIYYFMNHDKYTKAKIILFESTLLNGSK